MGRDREKFLLSPQGFDFLELKIPHTTEVHLGVTEPLHFQNMLDQIIVQSSGSGAQGAESRVHDRRRQCGVSE